MREIKKLSNMELLKKYRKTVEAIMLHWRKEWEDEEIKLEEELLRRLDSK